MFFDSSKCLEFYFKEQALRNDKDYDYLWCSYDTKVHKHMDFYELFFVSSGAPCHYYQGKKQELYKKWMFFFKPGEYHQLYTEPFQSVHFTFLGKPEFFDRYFEENPVFQNIFEEKNCISCEMTDVEYEYIFMLANNLTHEEEEEHSVSMLLYNALSLLMMHNGIERKGRGNAYVVDLMAKMNNFPYLNCKIQDIYKEYPIARCTLIKEFKEHTGMTITQYQKKQKLAYAAQLLNTSDCQITNVAMVLGFDSLSHFTRIFKEEYGMSPKEFRKLHRQK